MAFPGWSLYANPPPAPSPEKAPPKAPAADDASASSSPTDRAREITELCALAGQSAAEAAALIASDQSVEQVRHALITARATASSPPLAASLSSPVATALPRRERF
ncbi:hypothetical protein [Pararhodospirillum photometricum]|uniref:hypothetical protein n=1 Tax=Pararhodospirillum photometricum TaxID=1084 RepID=UPI0002EF8E2B|nr:hypothetical protein [Pararhodospirillum photometricum]